VIGSQARERGGRFDQQVNGVVVAHEAEHYGSALPNEWPTARWIWSNARASSRLSA
jgi:hypothetical protein